MGFWNRCSFTVSKALGWQRLLPQGDMYHGEQSAYHGQVVQAVTAIEDDTLHGHGLGEILGSLSLAGAGRAFWGAPKVQVQRPHESAVTPAWFCRMKSMLSRCKLVDMAL